MFSVYENNYLKAAWDQVLLAKYHSWNNWAAQPTACSSRSSKILDRMSRRSGTVMMRMKGNARDAVVDFTTHSATMHPSWVRVNIFIRHVFT